MNGYSWVERAILGVLLGVAPSMVSASDFVGEQGLDQARAEAIQAVVDRARRLVVQIQPIGGGDPLSGGASDATRPKTGLIVTTDGLILTSSFGFDPRPSALLVTYDGGQRTTAELLAIDRNRQLALLKPRRRLDPPPRLLASARATRVGQTSIALGRTLRADEPNVSVGIVSALSRLHGRAVQTDAAASPANYGGPLLNLHGEVMGVLTPLAPAAMAEAGGGLGGADWYDSGIGFAVPLPSVLARLERLRRGEDIVRGRAGLTFDKGSVYSTAPRIRTVYPGGPADAAGLRAGDEVGAVNGVSVSTVNAYRHVADALDDGETLSLVVLREGDRVAMEFELAAELQPYRHPCLGVIAQRVSERSIRGNGLAITAVFPGSAADAAGLAPGDVLLKINDSPLASRQEALDALAAIPAGETVRLNWRRDEQELSGTAKVKPLSFAWSFSDDSLNAAVPTEWLEKELEPTADAPACRLTRPARNDQRLPLLVLLGDGRQGRSSVHATDRGSGKADHLGEPQAAEAADATASRLAARGCLVVEPLPKRRPTTREELRLLLVSVLDRLKIRSDVDPTRIAIHGSGSLAPAVLSIASRGQSGLAGAVIADWPNQPLRVGPCRPEARVGLLVQGVGRRCEAALEQLQAQGYAADRPPSLEASNPGKADQSEEIAAWLAGLDCF